MAGAKRGSLANRKQPAREAFPALLERSVAHICVLYRGKFYALVALSDYLGAIESQKGLRSCAQACTLKQ